MEKKLKNSILTSYLIGAPVGILFICATVLLIMTGEGVITFLVYETYGTPLIGLVIAFLVALWFAGKFAHQNIVDGKSLLLTSFKYSSFVNLIIWAIFCLIILLTVQEDKFLMIMPALIAFAVCVIMTTFSIGLLIASIIRRINNKPTD